MRVRGRSGVRNGSNRHRGNMPLVELIQDTSLLDASAQADNLPNVY